MQILESTIRSQLLALEDKKNQAFLQKLLPTLDPGKIIGIKTPILRSFAKIFSQEKESLDFLSLLPHYYFEENMLHGFLLEQIKNFEQVLEYTDAFLPYINNWATCDSFKPKIFKQYPQELYYKIKIWIESSHVYTVRYAIWLLLSNYLDAYFQSEMLTLVASVQCQEYYVQMMQARYFATALVKQPDATLPLIQAQILVPFVQNKTIQKARESRRIDSELKTFLKNLKSR